MKIIIIRNYNDRGLLLAEGKARIVKSNHQEVLSGQPVLTADFFSVPTSGTYPLEVQFFDLSTGPLPTTTWDWDFGDGSPHSFIQDPIHEYTSDDSYTVSLTVGDGSTTDNETKPDYITVTIPTIYYVNPGSSTQDGLTPETGAHSVTSLQGLVSLEDGDIIEFVDNGIADDSGASVSFSTTIKLRSYSGNANKPTWKLKGDGDWTYNFALDFTGANKTVNIYDIKMICVGRARIGFSTALDTSSIDISRNFFQNIYFRDHEFWYGDKTISITNNIFTRSETFNEDFYISLNRGEAQTELHQYINNNVFYDFPNNAIDIGWQVHAYVFNNIFLGSGDACVVQHGNPLEVSIRNNLSFGITTPPGGDYELLVDPLLVSPETDDFVLQYNSPCISAGVGRNTQISVPATDYDGAARDLDAPYIGAFESATPEPVPPAPPDEAVSIIVDAISIPLFDNGSFSETVSLDGNNYGISLSWNARAGAWFMSIADGNGNMLRTGIRLNVAYPVKLQYNDVGLPAGDFLLLDQKEETGLQEAGRHDFTSGRKLELWYLNETD